MQYRVVATDAPSARRQLRGDLGYRVPGAVEDAATLVRDSSTHLVRSGAAPAIEALRTRKRRQYVGSWLPAPVDTGNAASAGPRPDGAGGIRYDMVESGTMAFLRALETLDPPERLVFVMSDAFGFQPQETAATLHFTAPTTPTLLHGSRPQTDAYG